MKKLLFFFLFTVLFYGPSLCQNSNLNEIARQYSISERLSSTSNSVDSACISLLISFRDSFPIVIFDTLCYQDLLLGRVGIPLVKLNCDEIKVFFSKPSNMYYDSTFGKKIEIWRGYSMVYFAYDKRESKFYKLLGFKNYDIIELIEDLKTKKIVRNKRDFIKKASFHKNINFNQMVKNNNQSYKYSFLREIEVSIYTGKDGNEYIKTNRK